jgi:uncharacterized protein (TIGR02687 family)
MNIQNALQNLFQDHRIVFWYDAKQELREAYEALTLPGVEKVELRNNAFGLKHRMLRQEPERRFLLYHDGPPPDDLDNWLLDVQLAHGEFRADQVSLWLAELGLGPQFWQVVQEHQEFFRATARRQALKARLEGKETATDVRWKMLAVCVNGSTDAHLEPILEALLAELSRGKDERCLLLQYCHLDTFLWQQVERTFDYTSDQPGVRDLAITLFKSGYARALGEPGNLNTEALVQLRRWKDSMRFREAYDILAEENAAILGIEKDLADRELQEIVDLDFFRLIDQRILADLVQQVADRTLSATACADVIRRRRSGHWYAEFSHIYEAIDHAAQFQAELSQADLHIQSLTDGVRKYSATWHRLDQHYRRFISHVRAARQPSLLGSLVTQIENLYSNNFLLKVNNNWQQVIDACDRWEAAPIPAQQHFFPLFVQGFLKEDKKVAVIISDALRFEIGAELAQRIEREDRYTADLEPMLSVLPSFTQLGMAALLPHETLSLQEAAALVDGHSTLGADNRGKVLAQAVAGGAAAGRAADILAMGREESRALVRDNQVIYVYHNQIDLVGDKRDSEERVFDAVETALDELVDLIKKLANANVTNMLVTADHGFIYQHRALDESDFAVVDVAGDDIQHLERRFVIGRGLQESPSLKKFLPDQLGLTGDFEVLIPKSINRLRLKGAGSRYVHGGAALQEVVVPVIHVNKKRSSDIDQVKVSVIRGTSSIISTGQLSVSLFQEQPVSTKRQPRRLRVGLYTADDTLISDQHELDFDFTNENPREREVPVRFVLGREAEDANNQDVFLRLEERVPDTSHYREYDSVRYTLRRSFTADFEL